MTNKTNFSSPRLVAITKLKSLIFPTIYCKRERKNCWIDTVKILLAILIFYSQNPVFVIRICRFLLVLKSKSLIFLAESSTCKWGRFLRTILNAFSPHFLIGWFLPEVPAVVRNVHKQEWWSCIQLISKTI